jgi:hypothetical protein
MLLSIALIVPLTCGADLYDDAQDDEDCLSFGIHQTLNGILSAGKISSK